MDEFAMPPAGPDEADISLDEMTTSPVHNTETAKEQSTAKKETTDFVFSTMETSLVSFACVVRGVCSELTNLR